MADTMLIRPARLEDAVAISALIHSVTPFLTVNPDGAGAGEFLKTITPEAVRGYIAADNFVYQVAWAGDQLAGVVAMRDYRHLYHLFVAPEFQRQGLARRLWEHARSQAITARNDAGFTVNSSVFAVTVYERFGFKASSPKVEAHGVAFVPMFITPETAP